MNSTEIEALARRTFYEGILEIDCPVCEAIIITEPDAEDLYCGECGKVTGKSLLTELGLI